MAICTGCPAATLEKLAIRKKLGHLGNFFVKFSSCFDKCSGNGNTVMLANGGEKHGGGKIVWLQGILFPSDLNALLELSHDLNFIPESLQGKITHEKKSPARIQRQDAGAGEKLGPAVK